MFDDPAITRLRKELAIYRERYGIEHGAIPTDRIDVAVSRRRTRMEYLAAQIDELQSEWTRLRGEIGGLERGLEAALGEELERIRRDHREAWSPSAVHGFRIWFAEEDGLRGARTVWAKPTMSASCARRPSDDIEVPHTDGRCGRLGCGVYATKRARPVIIEHVPPNATGWVAGLVALSGKVVEHDHGYRAAVAEVVAVAAVGPDEVITTADPARISALFGSPGPLVGEAMVRPHRADAIHEQVIEYLEDEMKRRTTWTSANSSA